MTVVNNVYHSAFFARIYIILVKKCCIIDSAKCSCLAFFLISFCYCAYGDNFSQ